jgi:hypothetical protein
VLEGLLASLRDAYGGIGHRGHERGEQSWRKVSVRIGDKNEILCAFLEESVVTAP